MTDETDHRQADSGRSNEQKEDAEVLATSGPSDDPDVFLVRYPDGDVAYEPGTPRNQVLFGDGKYHAVDGANAYDVDGTPIELVADVEADDYTISFGPETVCVPDDYIDDVIDAVTQAHPGRELKRIANEITEGQVRRNVVEAFRDRFDEDRVEVTADGWVIDDTFVVTYEATNHLLNVDPVGPRGVELDDSKQAVYLDLDASGERDVLAPDGNRYTLDETEQEFLTMVEGLLYPENYFGVELVDEIQQHKRDDERLGDVVEDMTEQAEVTGFTDSKTGIHHGSESHSFQKHDVADLHVTDEIRDKLWSNPYDHAAVHEMLLRKQEFINADADVFRDAEDDSEFKWNEIEKTSQNAPIPDDVRQQLDSMFA